MCRVLVLLISVILIMLPVKLFPFEIKIIADVNGEPISNLDIEKRLSLLDLISSSSIKEKRDLRTQILTQMIDEIIIMNESKRLNIKLSDKEINSAFTLFLTKSFKIAENEIDQYIKRHNIDLKILKRQMECQLLWNMIIRSKILPLISVSDEEVNDTKRQIEKPNCFVTFQEFIIPEEINKVITEDLINKLLDNINEFTSKYPIKISRITVNLSQMKSDLKKIIEELEINDTLGPIRIRKDSSYSVIKITDKTCLDYSLLESTLRIKQILVKGSQSLLESFRRQKANCLNFESLSKDFELPKVREFEIKMRDLNSNLQVLFSKIKINEVIEFIESDFVRLMMLCKITSNPSKKEDIKQQLYQQKVVVQSNLLLDSMRKNTAIKYYINIIQS